MRHRLRFVALALAGIILCSCGGSTSEEVSEEVSLPATLEIPTTTVAPDIVALGEIQAATVAFLDYSVDELATPDAEDARLRWATPQLAAQLKQAQQQRRDAGERIVGGYQNVTFGDARVAGDQGAAFACGIQTFRTYDNEGIEIAAATETGGYGRFTLLFSYTGETWAVDSVTFELTECY